METCKGCSAPERAAPCPAEREEAWRCDLAGPGATDRPSRPSRLRAAARNAAQMGRQKHHADDEFGRSCYFYPGTNTKNLMGFWVIVTFNLVFIQFFGNLL